MATMPRWRQWMGLAGVNAIIDFINQNTTSVGTLSSSKVDGAASSTNKAIARFTGTTGKVIQNSAPIVQDDGRISTVTDPSSAQDAATKAYVDALALNLGKRGRVRAATTATVTISTALNNGDSLDGITLATGDLVLVKNQAAPEQNGVYVVGVSPARFSEFDTYDEHPGSLIAVEEGTANADTLWLCTSNVGGTLNSTAIAFSAVTTGGGSGTVTHTGGALTSGKVVVGAGSDDVAVSTLTATVVKMTSGTPSAATGGTDYTDAAFKTIAVSGQSDVIADTAADTLTLAAGSNITITTNAGTDTVTIAASGSGSGTVAAGTYASLPGTCSVGQMYVLTDSVYPYAVCLTTNVWTFFLNGRIAVPPGPLSGWTTVNTGANWTASDAAGSIAVQIARNASQNSRALVKSQPSTPYTVTYYWKSQQQTSSSMLTGAYFYDGTKLMGLEFLTQNSVVSTIRVQKLTSATVDSGTAASLTSWWGAAPYSGGVYVKLANSGANLTFSWSLDGITFYDLFTEAIGTFITPTHYGFGGLNAATAGFLASISMQSIVVA